LDAFVRNHDDIDEIAWQDKPANAAHVIKPGQ